MRRRTTIATRDTKLVSPCTEPACPCCCSEEYFESEDGKVFICNSCQYATSNYDVVVQKLKEFNLMTSNDGASHHYE